MPEKKNYHMTPDQFREYGRRVVDWIADYFESVESRPVLSQVEPGDIRSKLPASPPAEPEKFDKVIEDLERVVMPGITHWQSPNFYAFFPANTSGPSILGELVAAGLGVQGMMWSTSPACTELETHVMDWMAEMTGIPEKFTSRTAGGGVIQDSASSAALCAILAARERATRYESNELGCDGRLTAYASTQAHSSIEKGIKIAGIGRENLRMVPVDDSLAMRPDALALRIKEDLQDGRKPFFVSATIGTTSSNAMDPLVEIGPLCKEHGIWLHVDGAMAGTATVCPEFRHFQNGLEFADSYCFNPHKWMFTNFDCDCFFVSERKALIEALSILPEYLRNQASESGEVIDYRDWQIPLGRRFRSLKLWFVIRHYGVSGLQSHIRSHVALARDFAKWVDQDGDFELAVPPPLNLVCFRHKGGDEKNENIMKTLNESGKMYLTHTKIQEKFTLRMCIGQTNTGRRHVEKAWERIRQAAAKV